MNSPAHAASATGRLVVLDGLRGVAALLVVAYRFNRVGEGYVQAGYLAVDFFFALSGLVLARAYQSRLGGGLAASRFVEMRVVRLYPLYLLGLTIGCAIELAGVAAHASGALPPGAIATAAAAGTLLLPDPLSPVALYPLNPPAWSLLFELLINAGFALVLARLRTRWLATIVLATFCAFGWQALMARDVNLGPVWGRTLLGGLGRVTCLFAAGMICARLTSRVARRANHWSSLLFVVFALALVVPVAADLRVELDLILIAVGVPAVLLAGVHVEVAGRARLVCERLGDISYPIYAVHYPLIFVWHWGAKRLGSPPPVEIGSFLVAISALGTALVPLDERVRKRISDTLRLRRMARAR